METYHPDNNQPPANYDFIINPVQPHKKPFLENLGGGSLLKQILILVGGAVILMIIIAVATNIFFGDKTNLNDLVSLTQQQTEIVRTSTLGQTTEDQSIKNAATNTALTITSQQQRWLVFLSKHNRSVDKKELALKKDISTDTKLATAEKEGTFNITVTKIVRTQLNTYVASLKNARIGATSKAEQALLDDHLAQTALLITQWPEPVARSTR